jgi:choline transporter-like protein 2/4/5
MLCCCSRIRLAVAVCKAAGQFIVDVCLIMLVPIFQTTVLLGFWAACLVVMIFLVSAATFKVNSSTDYVTAVGGYDDSSLIRFYIFVFATLWSHGMIQAIGTFVIASACTMWYYSHGPGTQLDTPIYRSYKMAFRFHFGSLAFGSLLLAIVQAL